MAPLELELPPVLLPELGEVLGDVLGAALEDELGEELGEALEPEAPEPLLPLEPPLLPLEPPAVPAPAPAPDEPLPEVELSEEPELPPLAAGEAPDGEELDEDELEGEADGEAGGVAEGVDEDDEPEGEAPDEDEDDDVSPPAEGAAGVLGVVAALLLELGDAGVVALELEVDPVAEPEAPPPESLLQPASKAATILAANRTFEGWVSFIVAFLLQVIGWTSAAFLYGTHGEPASPLAMP